MNQRLKNELKVDSKDYLKIKDNYSISERNDLSEDIIYDNELVGFDKLAY